MDKETKVNEVQVDIGKKLKAFEHKIKQTK